MPGGECAEFRDSAKDGRGQLESFCELRGSSMAVGAITSEGWFFVCSYGGTFVWYRWLVCLGGYTLKYNVQMS